MIAPSIVKSPQASFSEALTNTADKEITLRKGKFTEEEDELLKVLVGKHGRNWALISKQIPAKDRKQLRERYENFLSKKLKRTPFSEEEDNKILDLVDKIGRKFYKVAGELEGRTAIMIKNRYYTKLQRKRQPKIE